LTKIKFQGKNHSMFEYCPKVDRMCGFCAKSKYISFEDRYGDKENLLCGLANGYENRVDKLPECWKKMKSSERTSFSKKAKTQYEMIKAYQTIK
jgi:hypothetical protein